MKKGAKYLKENKENKWGFGQMEGSRVIML